MTAETFVLDMTGLMQYAAGIFNVLVPIVVIIGGISLGLGLVYLVMAAVKGAIKSF